MSYEQPPSSYSAPNSTMAIVSLIAGIAGFSVVPVIGSIVAVVTGHMAKKEIQESGGTIGGDGLATFGLVLGYAGLVLGVIGLCCLAILFLFPLLAIPFAIPSIESSLLPAALAVL
jgi:hypothetical protein